MHVPPETARHKAINSKVYWTCCLNTVSHSTYYQEGQYKPSLAYCKQAGMLREISLQAVVH